MRQCLGDTDDTQQVKREMARFNVYANDQETYAGVKHGWSWPAFFFPFPWALGAGMWLAVLFLLTLFAVFRAVWVIRLFILAAIIVCPAFVLLSEDFVQPTHATTNAEGLMLLTHTAFVVVLFCFGAFGNLWHAKQLKSRGFVYRDTVSAEDAEAACWMVRRSVEEASKEASQHPDASTCDSR